jgi:aspartyl-tRNA(Asn)/glutamyl-tRNA(Gln) amidotransferase subunit A
MTEIQSLDGAALLAAYRTRRLSPREVVADALARIARHDPAVNAFILVDGEAALAAAAASEARWAAGMPRGPLDGLPMTIKDNIAWAGHPMRRGSAR